MERLFRDGDCGPLGATPPDSVTQVGEVCWTHQLGIGFYSEGT